MQNYPYTFSAAGLNIEGTLYIAYPLNASYTAGHYSGILDGDFNVKFPVPEELCSTEIGNGPFVAKICFRANLEMKTLQGRVRTKNFPSGEWSDATWVNLVE